MNTAPPPEGGAAVPDHGLADPGVSGRKARHLELCVRPDRYAVEGPLATGFADVVFLHDALPELSLDEIDATTTFLGAPLAFPALVSCMTGGSAHGHAVNRALAAAAQAAGVPVGLGSMRVLFRHPEFIDQFRVKDAAPDVPVLANLGGQQLAAAPPAVLDELLARLEVQALVVHLNPAQELAQGDGDRDFRGIRAALVRCAEHGKLPLIVKETGMGLRPSLVRDLLSAGVAYVDLAGAGGTNWVTVEALRLDPAGAAAQAPFLGWGLPTAELLDAVGSCGGRVIASGGLRDGVDLAKAVALGAALGGMALPFARDAAGRDYSDDTAIDFDEAVARVTARLALVRGQLRQAMLLAGARDLAALARVPLLRAPGFTARVTQLAADGGGPRIAGFAPGPARG